MAPEQFRLLYERPATRLGRIVEITRVAIVSTSQVRTELVMVVEKDIRGRSVGCLCSAMLKDWQI